MQINIKSAGVLILTLAFLQIANSQETEIVVKPVMLAIPTIDEAYSVVHTQVYPITADTRFKHSVPADFYVQKALKKKESPNVQTINNQPQNILTPQKPQDQFKKQSLAPALLAENDKQSIAWAITPLNPLSTFVVENGVQHDIVQAIPQQQQERSKVEWAQEGKPPTRINPINQKAILTKPQSQITQQKPQNQNRPQPHPGTVTVTRQQRKPILSNPPQTNPQVKPKQQNGSSLVFIIIGTLVLVVIYVVARSQKKTKVSPLSILHSRLQNYKVEQEDEDLDSFSRSNSSLQQEDGSEDENEGDTIQIYRNTNVRLG